MNILNAEVTHIKLGTGTVISQDDKYIEVKFKLRTIKLQYPDAFRNFLTADDAEIDKAIRIELADIDAQILAAQQAAAAAKQAALDAQLAALATKSAKKPGVSQRIKRVDGVGLTFLVFQGSTFDAEFKGGYIWAPKYNNGGNTCHHWDRLLDVRDGDVIIHCADGYIEAFSTVKGKAYDAQSPKALSDEQLWAKDGRMVNCEYIKVQKPIKHSDYKETIKKYCNVMYAPFDKDGNGNMGYLFEVDRNLASFFIEKSSVKNNYLLGYEKLKELALECVD